MIYGYLFSASVALVGFTALFLVFRYQVIDIYVDNRKDILRSLLKDKIREESWLQVRIQDIGKDPYEDDFEYFNRFEDRAVNKFVDDILKLRQRRKNILNFGLLLISLWGTLSLVYIYQYSVRSSYYMTKYLFFIFVFFTLMYIISALSAKKPE